MQRGEHYENLNNTISDSPPDSSKAQPEHEKLTQIHHETSQRAGAHTGGRTEGQKGGRPISSLTSWLSCLRVISILAKGRCQLPEQVNCCREYAGLGLSRYGKYRWL